MAQRGKGIVTLGEAGKGLWDNILADRIRNTPGGMKKFGPGSGAKFFIDKFLELRGEKHSTEEAVRLASYDLFRLLYSRARTAGMTPQEATKTANRKAKFQARAWVGDLYTPPKGGYKKNPIQNGWVVTQHGETIHVMDFDQVSMPTHNDAQRLAQTVLWLLNREEARSLREGDLHPTMGDLVRNGWDVLYLRGGEVLFSYKRDGVPLRLDKEGRGIFYRSINIPVSQLVLPGEEGSDDGWVITRRGKTVHKLAKVTESDGVRRVLPRPQAVRKGIFWILRQRRKESPSTSDFEGKFDQLALLEGWDIVLKLDGKVVYSYLDGPLGDEHQSMYESNPSDPFFHPRAVKASSFSVTESLDPGTVPHRLLELFWELRKKGFTSKQSLSGVYAWGTSILSEQLSEEGFSDRDSRIMVKKDLNRQFKYIFGLSEEQIKVFEGTPPYYRQVGYPPGLINIIWEGDVGIPFATIGDVLEVLPEGRFDQALYEKLGQHFLPSDEEARLRASFVPLDENLGFRSHLPLRSYLENKFAGTGPRVGQIIPAWATNTVNEDGEGGKLGAIERIFFGGLGEYTLFGPHPDHGCPAYDFQSGLFPIVAASDDEEAQERAAEALYEAGRGKRVVVTKSISLFPPKGYVWPVDILTGDTWIDRYKLNAQVLLNLEGRTFPSGPSDLLWNYSDDRVYTSTRENGEAMDRVAEMQVFIDNLILPSVDLPEK